MLKINDLNHSATEAAKPWNSVILSFKLYNFFMREGFKGTWINTDCRANVFYALWTLFDSHLTSNCRTASTRCKFCQLPTFPLSTALIKSSVAFELQQKTIQMGFFCRVTDRLVQEIKAFRLVCSHAKSFIKVLTFLWSFQFFGRSFYQKCWTKGGLQCKMFIIDNLFCNIFSSSRETVN